MLLFLVFNKSNEESKSRLIEITNETNACFNVFLLRISQHFKNPCFNKPSYKHLGNQRWHRVMFLQTVSKCLSPFYAASETKEFLEHEMQIKSRLHKILHGARSSVKKKVLHLEFSRKSAKCVSQMHIKWLLRFVF